LICKTYLISKNCGCFIIENPKKFTSKILLSSVWASVFGSGWGWGGVGVGIRGGVSGTLLGRLTFVFKGCWVANKKKLVTKNLKLQVYLVHRVTKYI
jgi:hypothetical protein